MLGDNKKITELFIKLVKIDSHSGQERKLADFIIKKLKKLNLIVKQDKAGNIVARSKNFNKKNSVLICSHLDTIKSNAGITPKIKKGVIYSDGKNILGADNKAAIAEVIHALEKIKNKKNINAELLFTVQEEKGLLGVKGLKRNLIKSKKALVLDYNFPMGRIVLSTPAAQILKIIIFGKESHGARTKLGVNAINLACECLNKFQFKKQKGINYNIGLIKGGTAVNVVPKIVEIDLAVRADSEKKLDFFIRKMEGRFKKIVLKMKGEVRIEKTRVGYAYSYGKGDDFVKKIAKHFKQTKEKVKFEKSWGMSDANILNSFGIKAIEISYGPKNVHTAKESVAARQMVKMSQFLTNFLIKKSPLKGHGA